MLAASAIPAAITMVIISPVYEELLFRKAMQQIVNNKIVYIILSSLLFGLFHGVSPGSVTQVVMGAIYAVIYLKTDKNVVAAIASHFMNNLIAVVLLLI
jgi:membrane protease YdiL (CAAX protease family)